MQLKMKHNFTQAEQIVFVLHELSRRRPHAMLNHVLLWQAAAVALGVLANCAGPLVALQVVVDGHFHTFPIKTFFARV